jgi:two-component system response regulator YesN
MFRLLIVDDEVIIANGIKSSFDWKGLGFVKVVTAYNMRQAKEAFASDPFDVMICDIEMPQGTGFDLFSWVREAHPRTECIFLTCHMEFDYAKKAIQLGSLDYLLKPVLEEELKKAVVTALMKIRQERDNDAKLLERLWLDVLRRELPARASVIIDETKRLHLSYTTDSLFLPVLIHLNYWDKALEARDEQIMLYALRNSLEELVISHFRGSHAVYLGDGSFVLIVPSENHAVEALIQSMADRCVAYIEACNAYFYCHLSCYIGRITPIEQLAYMYELLAQFQRSQVNTADRVLLLDEQPRGECMISLPNMQVWVEMLRRMEQDRLLDEMSAYLEGWKAIDSLDTKWLQRFYQSFLQVVLHTLQETGLRAEEMLHGHLALERAMVATRSIRDLQSWATDVIVIAVSSMKALESNETIVDKIRRFIELHLDDELLSRQYIADYVGLSPDYVVKLFKKETGVSISDYLLQQRLSRAKELLLKSDMSISDVALSVGYANFSYFSTLFRKETAMTAQEFRRRYVMHKT